MLLTVEAVAGAVGLRRRVHLQETGADAGEALVGPLEDLADSAAVDEGGKGAHIIQKIGLGRVESDDHAQVAFHETQVLHVQVAFSRRQPVLYALSLAGLSDVVVVLLLVQEAQVPAVQQVVDVLHHALVQHAVVHQHQSHRLVVHACEKQRFLQVFVLSVRVI